MTTYFVQPQDDDLDEIADLVTTDLGRSLLAVSDLPELYAILAPTGTPGSGTFLRGDQSWAAAGGGGGGGAVDSVNGQTGAVTLTAANVSAQPVDSDLTAIAALTTTAYGRAFLALADAAAGRTALGLGTAATTASSAYDAAGSAAAAQAAAIAASQPVDADLTAIAALTTTSVGRSLLAAVDAAAIRTIAGAQASDTDLTAIAALTSAADKVLYATGAGTWALADMGSFARGLLALTTSSAVRSYLGLVIGTNVQAWDADLDAIAALTTTAYGRAFLTLADGAALRGVLGTGTPSGSNFLRGDGTWAAPSASGSVATDAIWDTKGDLAVATAADTATKLAAGANNTFLVADSAQATGLKWADAATSRTALGLGTAATSATGDFQPNDADLTAIAALTTTSYGRSVLTAIDAAAARTTLGVGIGTDVQGFDADLANIAALSTTSYGRSLLTVADASAARTSIGVEAHIQETDPFVHTAPKIAYTGTLSATDVADALDELDANKVDNGPIAVLESIAGVSNQGTNYHFEDDFLAGGTVSGAIGEKAWLRTAGGGATNTCVKGTGGANHPGDILLGTGATSGGFVSLHLNSTAEAQQEPDSVWKWFWFIKPNAVSNGDFRCGWTSDPTTDAPVEGIYIEHLATDANFFTVIRKASVSTRVDMGVAYNAAGWYRFGASRASNTADIIFSIRPAAGSETLKTSTAPGTFVPLTAFAMTKTTAAVTKTMDVDRYESSFTLAR
jgi:hypothetical protein